MGDCILGIETSCDETAAAVVERATRVRSSVVASQIDQHARYGGVVPEIASRMLLALARGAIERGCVNLTLEVRMSNSGAQALYQRFGFVPAGVRKGYYPETGEDALVMWANDVDRPAYAARLAAIERRVPGRTVIDGGWL